eukprot:412745_1
MAADIQICFASKSDAAAITNIYEHYVKNTASNAELTAPTINEMKERIMLTMMQYPWLVCKVNGKIIGYCYATSFHKRPGYRFGVEVSIYLDHNRESKYYGIGKYLYQCLMDILRYQGYYYCIATVNKNKHSKNSQDIHEKLGFKNIGAVKECIYKFNAWFDVIYYQKMLRSVEIENILDPVPIQRLIEQLPGTINQTMQMYASRMLKHVSSKL